ncbi:glycoside hydrolase [Plectosphaerella cucumerina]|uniref:endo-polygalacturonase n=1 Tax=Plectosphaerella cucumerina TaxID=40658 RepID=A0A8K0TKZ3_9PEZI|nr:glycoside hydrolase [Plectosphaerella cucumerina]
MFPPKSLFTLGALASAVSATPAPARLAPRTVCNFSTYAQITGVQNCDTITLQGIHVPAGATINLENLKAGAHVTFAGTTTFDYQEFEGFLIQLKGERITVEGAPGHVIECNGSRWWDGKGSNGGKKKPKVLSLHNINHSVIRGLNIQNTPEQAVSILATNLELYDIHIKNTDPQNLAHNTDGFDIGNSNNIWIQGAVVENQDDCVAINSGKNVTFTGGTCSGGHGLSVGSVGGRDNNVVDGVFFLHSKVSKSQNGVRIKTVATAPSGSVNNVHFEDITLSEISDFGVTIIQNYVNTGPKPANPGTNIAITNVAMKQVRGSVLSSAVTTEIVCGNCKNFTPWDVQLTGGKKGDCRGAPAGVTC